MQEPLKSEDIPVPQKMLEAVKQELKSELTSVRLEMKSGFTAVNARFDSVDARFDSMDAKFILIEAKLSEMLAAIHKSNANIEEQNSRNRYVLDGYASIYDSQTEVKNRLIKLEKNVFGKEQS